MRQTVGTRAAAPRSQGASTAGQQRGIASVHASAVTAARWRTIMKTSLPGPAPSSWRSSTPASPTAYLRFPADHHKRIRRSNFIERTFGETRRRVRSSAGSRRDQLPHPRVGRPGPRLGRLARPDHELKRPAPPAGPAPLAARTTPPAPARHQQTQPARAPPKLSAPSRNLIMKPGTTPAGLHRIRTPPRAEARLK
jgi:hypothetical protein